MNINVENRQNRVCLNEDFIDFIEEVVKCVLNFEEVNIECEIVILFVDNETIREINFEHREINRETDCLSFPMLYYQEGKVFKDQYKNFKFKDHDMNGENLLLGDIIISLEKAQSQSLEFGHKFEREVSYLVIHSLLHLLGYDHIEEKDKKIMRCREKEIIKKLRIFR